MAAPPPPAVVKVSFYRSQRHQFIPQMGDKVSCYRMRGRFHGPQPWSR